jgi:multiple sugar transport system ATP-binding protein
MNLLPAERDGNRVRVADWSLDPPGGAPERVIAGVRPEHVLLSREGAATGHVVAVEPLGAETHVDVESGGALLRVRVEGFDAPAVGEAVAISPRPGKLRWFDADTGRAL